MQNISSLLPRWNIVLLATYFFIWLSVISGYGYFRRFFEQVKIFSHGPMENITVSGTNPVQLLRVDVAMPAGQVLHPTVGEAVTEPSSN